MRVGILTERVVHIFPAVIEMEPFEKAGYDVGLPFANLRWSISDVYVDEMRIARSILLDCAFDEGGRWWKKGAVWPLMK